MGQASQYAAYYARKGRCVAVRARSVLQRVRALVEEVTALAAFLTTPHQQSRVEHCCLLIQVRDRSISSDPNDSKQVLNDYNLCLAECRKLYASMQLLTHTNVFPAKFDLQSYINLIANYDAATWVHKKCNAIFSKDRSQFTGIQPEPSDQRCDR